MSSEFNKSLKDFTSGKTISDAIVGNNSLVFLFTDGTGISLYADKLVLTEGGRVTTITIEESLHISVFNKDCKTILSSSPRGVGKETKL